MHEQIEKKTRTVRGSYYSPAIELSEQKDKLVTSQQSLVKFCQLVLKILRGNEILTSIKGCHSVANLRNLTLYNPNLDIINVNVYTKFNSILSIGSHDIKRKRNSDINQGP